MTDNLNSTTVLRKRNRDTLLGLLACNGQMSRTQMAEETGLTTAAISRITREMILAGILLEGESIPTMGRKGRREVHLTINSSGAFVIAISLTANRKCAAIANAVGEVIAAVEFDDLDLSDPDTALVNIAERIKIMVYDSNFNRGRLLGVGITAAISDKYSPDLVTSSPLDWQDVPLQTRMAELLQLPIKIEPRASALLKSEMLSHNTSENIYLVNVALSIGVSAFLNGQIYTSGFGGFGSIAHMVLDGETDACSCGRSGCIDALSSGHAILRRLSRANGPMHKQAVEMINVIELAGEDDQQACEAFLEAGEKLGVGLDKVLSLFQLQKIILAGEVGRQKDFQNGVLRGLKNTGRDISNLILASSKITTLNSAISSALQEFVFSESLDLDRLKSASKTTDVL